MPTTLSNLAGHGLLQQILRARPAMPSLGAAARDWSDFLGPVRDEEPPCACCGLTPTAAAHLNKHAREEHRGAGWFSWDALLFPIFYWDFIRRHLVTQAALLHLRDTLAPKTGQELLTFRAHRPRRDAEHAGYVSVLPCTCVLPALEPTWWSRDLHHVPRTVLLTLAAPLVIHANAGDVVLVQPVKEAPFPIRARETPRDRDEPTTWSWWAYETFSTWPIP